MRLPNGMGSAYKMQGTRRKPWMARKTIGYTEEGKQLYHIIGYFKTKKEAIEALGKASNLSFTDTDKMLTVQEVFDKAISRGKYSENTIIMYKSVYRKFLTPIARLQYDRITLDKMQSIADSASVCSAKHIANVFRLMDTYALEYDYILKGYAQFIRTKTLAANHERTPFTYSEIEALWLSDNPTAEIFLIYLYTGLRKNELLKIKKTEIIIDSEIPYLRTGSKTKAGKNRIIPIHHRILPIIEKYYNTDSECPFMSFSRKKLAYFLEKHYPNHCVHETRHTFRSELDRLNVNQVIIDRLLGHSNKSIGERVYTHKTIEELKNAVEKICYK